MDALHGRMSTCSYGQPRMGRRHDPRDAGQISAYLARAERPIHLPPAVRPRGGVASTAGLPSRLGFTITGGEKNDTSECCTERSVNGSIFPPLLPSSSVTESCTEIVLLTLHATEFGIHELALNFEDNTDPMKRLEVLRSCLKSLEDWFQVFLDFPPSRHFGLNFSIFLHLVHAIVALFRLSTTDSIPSWSLVEVKNRLHLATILDRVSDHLGASDEALSMVKDDPGEETSKCRSPKVLQYPFACYPVLFDSCTVPLLALFRLPQTLP